MTTLTVYRYDDVDYPDGQVLKSRGDHIVTLHATRLDAEAAIRDYSGTSQAVRRDALFTWRDVAWALRAWPLSRKKYLYELSVDPSDVLHTGDTNCYSAVQDGLEAAQDVSDSVRRYWEGAEEPGYGPSRVEVLVSKAVVLQKLKP